MPRLAGTKSPSYCQHKSSGQAVVRINGRDYYLGRFGSPESRDRYQQLIAQWNSGVIKDSDRKSICRSDRLGDHLRSSIIPWLTTRSLCLKQRFAPLRHRGDRTRRQLGYGAHCDNSPGPKSAGENETFSHSCNQGFRVSLTRYAVRYLESRIFSLRNQRLERANPAGCASVATIPMNLVYLGTLQGNFFKRAERLDKAHGKTHQTLLFVSNLWKCWVAVSRCTS